MSNPYSYNYSDVVIRKISDGDFQTKMASVEYSTSPREIVTVRHMENYYNYYNNSIVKGVYGSEKRCSE